MATNNPSALNALYARLAPGTPLTSEDLAALGISADLAVHYVRAGWLTRLACDSTCRSCQYCVCMAGRQGACQNGSLNASPRSTTANVCLMSSRTLYGTSFVSICVVIVRNYKFEQVRGNSSIGLLSR